MILAPPVKNSGELHSSTAIWASALQKMAPKPGVMVDSARPLAAVPLVTRKARRSQPNTSFSFASARIVWSSPP